MGKIIVDNRSALEDRDALQMVLDIVRAGRISNGGRQYCYLTVFHKGGELGDICVASDLNKNSDRFVVYEEPKKDKIK